MAEKQLTKIESILRKHQINKREYCRLIGERTGHYITYEQMYRMASGTYESSVSLKRARHMVKALNEEFETNYTVDDLFD